jgi:hypothetical protein
LDIFILSLPHINGSSRLRSLTNLKAFPLRE